MSSKQSFPNLYKLLQSLGSDNNMILRPDPQWDTWINYNLLEYQATSFMYHHDTSYDVIETFVNGEVSEADKITERFNLQGLSAFLNLAFDGDFNKKFYL